LSGEATATAMTSSGRTGVSSPAILRAGAGEVLERASCPHGLIRRTARSAREGQGSCKRPRCFRGRAGKGPPVRRGGPGEVGTPVNATPWVWGRERCLRFGTHPNPQNPGSGGGGARVIVVPESRVLSPRPVGARSSLGVFWRYCESSDEVIVLTPRASALKPLLKTCNHDHGLGTPSDDQDHFAMVGRLVVAEHGQASMLAHSTLQHESETAGGLTCSLIGPFLRREGHDLCRSPGAPVIDAYSPQA
jgi:hypothetical protein